jgi:hypothetical protein
VHAIGELRQAVGGRRRNTKLQVSIKRSTIGEVVGDTKRRQCPEGIMMQGRSI